MISFARGAPAPECIPVAELADCARAAVERDGIAALSYGPVGGYAPLREWLGERHGVPPERVLITNGGLQGLLFVAETLLARGGRRVLVEGPTYDRTLTILAKLGAEVEGVPMDEEGLDLEALATALDARPPPAFIYTIPTFQNPSGRTLGPERRRRLVELAREHGVPLLEDDPYGLVRFEGEPPPTLHELVDGESVVYASSFSKTIAPGVRVGYFVLPAPLLAELEGPIASTYISPGTLAQGTVYEFLRRGRLEPNLERVRGLLRARRDSMLEALERELGGSGATWSRPKGGYFLWLDVPSADTRELLAAAADAGVVFVPGPDFGGPPSSARLAYSFVSPAEIASGVTRLAGLVSAPAAV